LLPFKLMDQRNSRIENAVLASAPRSFARILASHPLLFGGGKRSAVSIEPNSFVPITFAQNLHSAVLRIAGTARQAGAEPAFRESA
jgi:hypothetical protein